MALNILLWNIEWNATKQKRSFVLSTIKNISPSIFCLTEATDFFVSQYPNVICSTPDYGYPNPGNRRKVWLWSDDSWSYVEYGESPEMPSGRFVSVSLMAFDSRACAYPGRMLTSPRAIEIENAGKIIERT